MTVSLRSLCAALLPLLAQATCTLRDRPIRLPANAAVARREAGQLALYDSFDGVLGNEQNDHALNLGLAQRQSGSLAPAGYVRVPGVWYQAPPASSEAVRVGEIFTMGGTMSFHGNGAVRLDTPIAPDTYGGYRITATVSPVISQIDRQSWVSVILTESRESLGWPTLADASPGVLLRSNGAVHVFHRGTEVATGWEQSPPAPASEYQVSLDVRPVERGNQRVLVLRGTVNEASFTALLSAGPDVAATGPVYVIMGAHFHPGDQPVSLVNDLRVY